MAGLQQQWLSVLKQALQLALFALSRSTCGLVAMTSASQAEGRQFDPGQVYILLQRGASKLRLGEGRARPGHARRQDMARNERSPVEWLVASLNRKTTAAATSIEMQTRPVYGSKLEPAIFGSEDQHPLGHRTLHARRRGDHHDSGTADDKMSDRRRQRGLNPPPLPTLLGSTQVRTTVRARCCLL